VLDRDLNGGTRERLPRERLPTEKFNYFLGNENVIRLTRDLGTGCCGYKVYSVRLGNGSGTDFRYTRNIDFETLRDVTPKSGNFKKWLFDNPKVRTFCFSGGTRLFSKK
jgi:hypothetical protein